MNNNANLAEKWTKFIAARPEFPAGAGLITQFEAGTITRLCDCGCNSYGLTPSESPDVPGLVAPGGHGGSVFDIEFAVKGGSATVEFHVFVDGLGRLSGIDADYCGNSSGMPHDIELVEPPINVRASELFAPNNSFKPNPLRSSKTPSGSSGGSA
jgi:hypothetical protein